MSSPTGTPSIPESTYQSAEPTDHGLISPPHHNTCLCDQKSEPPNHAHQHCHPPTGLSPSHHRRNVLGLPHAPSPTTNRAHSVNQSVHVHVHASPKTGHAPKIIPLPPSCGCHLHNASETPVEIHDSNRKLDADDSIEVSPLPPALPPRPPPRPRIDGHGTLNSRTRGLHRTGILNFNNIYLE